MQMTATDTKAIISFFETVLRSHGRVSLDDLNNALNAVVKKYSEDEATEISSYVSKRVGIAEWIVKYDIKQRYGRSQNNNKL